VILAGGGRVSVAANDQQEKAAWKLQAQATSMSHRGSNGVSLATQDDHPPHWRHAACSGQIFDFSVGRGRQDHHTFAMIEESSSVPNAGGAMVTARRVFLR